MEPEIVKEGEAEASALPDPAIAKLTSELADARERGDKLESDFLAQSDKLAAANTLLAKAEGDADTSAATIAKLNAQIAALGATPAPAPAVVAVKRPKVGKVLKLPEDGARAKAVLVADALAQGELLMMVFVDDNGRVQPFPAMVGGQEVFVTAANGVRLAPGIELKPEMDGNEIRHAVLLDADGKVLSACRLGALLLGGGGLSAMIPGNGLLFAFD